MGTDLFTSVRGPGLIGGLLAATVLIGFGVLYLFVFDERLQGRGQSLESIIESDALEIARLEERRDNELAALETTENFKRIAGELRSESTRLGIARDRREKLEADSAEAVEDLAGVGKSFDEYRRAYRQAARDSMVGRELDEFTTSDGKTFRQVTITSIDPVRMQIRHQTGITGVPLDTLPDDLQEYLQIDDSEKESRLAAESELRQRDIKQVAQADLVRRIRGLRQRLEETRRLRGESMGRAERARDAVPQLERAIQAKNAELRAEEAKSRSGGISNAPQVRVELSRLEEQLRLARSQQPALADRVAELDREIESLEKQIRELEEKMDLEESSSTGAG